MSERRDIIELCSDFSGDSKGRFSVSILPRK